MFANESQMNSVSVIAGIEGLWQCTCNLCCTGNRDRKRGFFHNLMNTAIQKSGVGMILFLNEVPYVKTVILGNSITI